MHKITLYSSKNLLVILTFCLDVENNFHVLNIFIKDHLWNKTIQCSYENFIQRNLFNLTDYQIKALLLDLISHQRISVISDDKLSELYSNFSNYSPKNLGKLI